MLHIIFIHRFYKISSSWKIMTPAYMFYFINFSLPCVCFTFCVSFNTHKTIVLSNERLYPNRMRRCNSTSRFIAVEGR